MKLKTIIAVQLFIFTLLFSSLAEAGFLKKLQWKAEKHFGKGTKKQIEMEYGFIEDPLLKNYIEQTGAKLVAVSHRTDIPYEFHIVDSDEMNAFAAPGGFIFVTRGLIEEVESDDELTAVMGHEVGHVAAHHGAKRIKKFPFLIAGMNILYSRYGSTAARVGGIVLSLFQLHHSREDEYQADRLGVEYAFNSGYDPAGMESFFAKMERKHRTGDLGRLQVALSSHPKTPSRLREINNSAPMRETPENLVRIGGSYMERYYYHEAADRYRRALELEPGSVSARLGLADALVQLGRYDDARDNLALLLEQEPENPAAIELLEVRLPEAEAAYGGDEPAAPADAPAPPADDLSGAIAAVQDALDGYEKRYAKLDKKINEMEGEFDTDIPALRETFAALYDRGIAGDEVFGYASYFYSHYTSALRVAGEAGREIGRDLKDARRRAREVLFAVRTQPGSVPEKSLKRFVSAVEWQARQAGEEAGTLDDAIFGIARSYRSMKREVDSLASLLSFDGASLSFWEEEYLVDREEANLEAVVRGMERMMDGRAGTRSAAVEMRAAALHIATTLLSPREDATYRRMLARRFGLDEDRLASARSESLGYFDAVLFMGRRAAGSKEAEKEEEPTVDWPETLISSDVIGSSRDTSARKIILHLAEIDLKHLTQKKDLGVRLLPPGDFPASFDSAMAGVETDAALDRAQALLRGGRAEEAEKIIHERGRSAPATARAHLLLGLAHKKTDRYDDALREFGRAEKKGAPRLVAAYLMGNALLEMEAYAEALGKYSAVLDEEVADPAFHTGAGYALAMTGEDERAKEHFNAALELSPGSAGGPLCGSPACCAARNNLAILLYREGLIAESEEQFRLYRESCQENSSR